MGRSNRYKAILIDSGKPARGLLRGATNEGLFVDGKGKYYTYYNRVGELGLLRVPFG